jgi:hypothetical protein
MKLVCFRLFSDNSLKDKYLSLITITVLLLYSLNGSAQYDSTKIRQQQNSYGFEWKNAKFISSQIIPKDTLHLSVSDSGAIAYKGLKLWVYNGYSWLQSSSSSIGGGGVINAYDSVALNFDSSYYKFYSGGLVIDTINTLVKNLYGLGRIKLIDSTNGNGYITWDSTGFSGSGGSSIDTTSLSNRILQNYNSIQQSTDSSYFLIKNLSGGSDTVFINYSSVGLSQWVTNGSNIHYPNGNVGINNINPTEKFDIVGNININSGSYFKYNGLPIISAITASKNYFIGNSAGNFTTSGIGLTAMGDSALLANTTASNNTAFGRQSLRKNTTGFANTALGSFSLSNNLTTSNNTAVGYSSLYNNTAIDNTSIGSNAMFSNTSGYGNTAIGTTSLVSNIGGYYNTATGQSSLYTNTSGFENVANGYWALIFNTSGSENVAMGVTAMRQNKTGSQNVAIGREALRNDTSGNTNTGLGYQVGYSNFNGNGNVLLGYKSGFFETGSNKLYISNSNTSTPLIYGDFANPSIVINGGTVANDASSIFTVTSNIKGVLLPKMTKTERNAISSPAQGLIVFVTDNGGYLSWYNSGWLKISSTAD